MAGREGSVAPKERINIRYVPATGDQQEEVELPLRLVMLGDYFGHDDGSRLEDREMISIDKNSFASVMAEAGLKHSINVKNTLVDDPEAILSAELEFESLDDFTPDSVVKQVPELNTLLQLREALVALKGPLGNMPSFRSRIEQLLKDEDSRKKLLSELENAANNDPASAETPDEDTDALTEH